VIGFVLALLVAAPLRFSAADLGVLDPSTPATVGSAVNDAGVVVGNSAVAGHPHPIYWNGSLHDIGTLGGSSGNASAINGGGTIVGWAVVGPHLFAYASGRMTDLGAPRHVMNFGSAYINDSDVIVASPFGDDQCDASNTPFVIDLTVGPMRTSLKMLSCTLAAGIDDREQILGDPFIGSRFVWGFLNAKGRNFRPLGSAAATLIPTAIDPVTDHIAGDVPIGLDQYPALYVNSTNTLTILPATSPALPTGLALAINRHDDIVGTACATTGQCDGGNDAFLYDPRFGSIDLNVVSDLPTGFASYVAVAINDREQIVVNALGGAGGSSRSFLLTPRIRATP